MRRVLFQEGLLYYWCVDTHGLYVVQLSILKLPYSVICTITLVLTIMINSTCESIRNITSQYACFHHHFSPRPV